MQRLFALSLLLLGVAMAQAQSEFLPLQTQSTFNYRRIYNDSVSVHWGLQPLTLTRKVLRSETFSGVKNFSMKRAVGRKLFNEHLVDVKGEDYFLTVDPLLDVWAGREASLKNGGSNNVMNNSRGVLVQAGIGEKLSLHSGFVETQSFFPDYYRSITETNGSVPGMGRYKSFQSNGFDYSMSFGAIEYRPTKGLQLRMGYGKNFVGFGYRSHLISDAAFNYPYLAATWTSRNGKWKYHTMYASLQSLERLPKGDVPESLFKRKGMSANYLSFLPHRKVEIGLFERTMWQRWDSTGTKALPFEAYVPVMGVSTALNGFNQKQALAVGAQLRWNVWRKLNLYAQGMMTYTEKDHRAYQLGVQWLDAFFPRLDVQLEFNHAGREFGNNRILLQNDEHFNQSIGSPVGAGRNEFVAIVRYQRGRWCGSVKYNDRRTNYPIYTVLPFPDDYLSLRFFETDVAWILNPATNARIFLHHTALMRVNEFRASIITAGFSTSIFNRYYDF